MDRVLLQESTVEGDDLVDMKSERKHVERGNRLKSEVKRLKSKVKRLKSERKHVERGTRLKSEPERKQTGDRESTVEGDDLVDMKSERKHVERVKRLKSERKHVERCMQLKSDVGTSRITHDRVPDRKLSPFGTPGRAGSLIPIPITDKTPPYHIKHSKIALEMYNDANNQDPQFEPFEFDEVVKATQGSCSGVKYFITFKAKRSSDTSSNIFQGIVLKRFNEPSKVLSCAIKT